MSNAEQSFEFPEELALDDIHPNLDLDEELQFQDDILQQTEKFYDVIEDLELANNSNWSSTKYHPEALKKLNFIKEKLKDIYKDSIGLMEFEARVKMKDQDGYECISMTLTAWEKVKEQLKVSKEIISKLPLDPKHASIREERIQRILKMKELDQTEKRNEDKANSESPINLVSIISL